MIIPLFATYLMLQSIKQAQQQQLSIISIVMMAALPC
jgi:hypothetical protein